jgi:type 1 fimbriae regulatory protein FimB/type 1 fimbriae regulatory protein FimE
MGLLENWLGIICAKSFAWYIGDELCMLRGKTLTSARNKGLRRMSSSTPNEKLPPNKPKNVERRAREYLTFEEVLTLIEAARTVGRHKDRDAILILMAYRHGLRSGEIVHLRWQDIDLDQRIIRVDRLKNGRQSIHDLESDEVELLSKLHLNNFGCEFVFSSERTGPLTKRAVHTIIARAGQLAGFEFSVHPHMLRHSKGFHLAASGADPKAIQAYFGHRNRGSSSHYRLAQPEKESDNSASGDEA